MSSVRALIDERGLDEVVLIGLSTGGVVAGMCAAYDAEALRGVLIDDGPYKRTDADIAGPTDERERAIDGHERASLDEVL